MLINFCSLINENTLEETEFIFIAPDEQPKYHFD